MATYHIPESEVASSLPELLAKVRAGGEVVIESGTLPIAVLQPPAPPRRTIEECLALLPQNSSAVMDDDFARDVAETIEAHREPLDPPAWD